MDKSARSMTAAEEVVPLTDLDHILKGNRALRRKFLSNLRRRAKQAKKEEARQRPST